MRKDEGALQKELKFVQKEINSCIRMLSDSEQVKQSKEEINYLLKYAKQEKERLCKHIEEAEKEQRKGKYEPYKACIVALDPEEGILFAKRSDCVEQTDHILMDDIMRIMEDGNCDVTLHNSRDGYDEWTTDVLVKDKLVITYKVCFDEENEEERN